MSKRQRRRCAKTRGASGREANMLPKTSKMMTIHAAAAPPFTRIDRISNWWLDDVKRHIALEGDDDSQ